jgi:hypothetical protein
MIRVVVERSFPDPMSDADIDAFGAREHACRAIYRVTWKRTLLSEDRKRVICEFEAPDAESVRRVQRQSETEAERVWTAQVIE